MDSDDDSTSSDDDQLQWEEDVEQLKFMFSYVLVPLFARLLGRKVAFWMWHKWTGKPWQPVTLYRP
jgi:hypothetical protein